MIRGLAKIPSDPKLWFRTKLRIRNFGRGKVSDPKIWFGRSFGSETLTPGIVSDPKLLSRRSLGFGARSGKRFTHLEEQPLFPQRFSKTLTRIGIHRSEIDLALRYLGLQRARRRMPRQSSSDTDLSSRC